MGRLSDLIQAHVDAQPYPPSANTIARRLGVSPTTVRNWQTPTKLIDREHLVAISELTKVPYARVLDALLEDIGYLRPPAPPSPRRRDAG